MSDISFIAGRVEKNDPADAETGPSLRIAPGRERKPLNQTIRIVSHIARRASWARVVIHNENGAIHRNGGNVAGRIQQCGCRRALFFPRGRRSTGVSPDRHTSIGHRFMEPPESGIAPPSPNSLNDPQHWRDRAEQARAIAVQMSDVDAIAAMLSVAANYELLAKRAEERVRESQSQNGA
jgi:hypothetical protein